MRSISHILFLLILASFATLLAACETVVDPEGLPYVERLVVRGVVNTGQPIDSISITRTLPLTEEYTEAAAAVTDALVTVSVGGQSYLLQSIGSGFYGNRALTALAGETYRLDIDWHGKHATATTVAPFPVPIDSGSIVPAPSDDFGIDSAIEIRFRPHGDQVYAVAARMVIRDGSPIDSSKIQYDIGIGESEGIARRRDTLPDGTIALRGRIRFWNWQSERSSIDTVTAVLYTFDAPFYDYYQTFGNNGNNDNGPFSTGSDTVVWNVDGDGIGMFIGRAVSERRIRP